MPAARSSTDKLHRQRGARKLGESLDTCRRSLRSASPPTLFRRLGKELAWEALYLLQKRRAARVTRARNSAQRRAAGINTRRVQRELVPPPAGGPATNHLWRRCSHDGSMHDGSKAYALRCTAARRGGLSLLVRGPRGAGGRHARLGPVPCASAQSRLFCNPRTSTPHWSSVWEFESCVLVGLRARVPAVPPALSIARRICNLLPVPLVLLVLLVLLQLSVPLLIFLLKTSVMCRNKSATHALWMVLNARQPGLCCDCGQGWRPLDIALPR